MPSPERSNDYEFIDALDGPRGRCNDIVSINIRSMSTRA